MCTFRHGAMNLCLMNVVDLDVMFTLSFSSGLCNLNMFSIHSVCHGDALTITIINVFSEFFLVYNSWQIY